MLEKASQKNNQSFYKRNKDFLENFAFQTNDEEKVGPRNLEKDLKIGKCEIDFEKLFH